MRGCDGRAVGYRLSAVGLLAVGLLGCGYGEVSAGAYGYAQALYALSNKQAAGRIEAVAAQVAASQEKGEITRREAAWLGAILDDCRASRWEAAQSASRRLMEDQAGR